MEEETNVNICPGQQTHRNVRGLVLDETAPVCTKTSHNMDFTIPL